jgi:hypothetical protein
VTVPRTRLFAFMALGFGIWSLAFAVLYAVQATGCAFGWHTLAVGPVSLLRMLLIAIWVAHLAALAWLYVVCRQAAGGAALDRFLARAAAALTAAAIAATVWIGTALFLRTICV